MRDILPQHVQEIMSESNHNGLQLGIGIDNSNILSPIAFREKPYSLPLGEISAYELPPYSIAFENKENLELAQALLKNLVEALPNRDIMLLFDGSKARERARDGFDMVGTDEDVYFVFKMNSSIGTISVFELLKQFKRAELFRLWRKLTGRGATDSVAYLVENMRAGKLGTNICSGILK